MNSLAGKRVWLTRSVGGNRAWEPHVRATGAIPISYPCLRFELLTKHRVDTANTVKAADWVVFSSPRGVQAFHDLGLKVSNLQKLACVGAATAERCFDLIGESDLEPECETAKDLADALLDVAAWESAALIGALRPRPELQDRLTQAGKQASACPVYMTVGSSGGPPPASMHSDDAVLLASPSAFESLWRNCGLPHGISLISIGPTTSHAIRDAGFQVAGESKSRDIFGLLEALENTCA